MENRTMAKRKEKVTKVIAGDTFLTRSRRHPVRLANVDAAEKRSKTGPKATERLKRLIQGKEVEVHTLARDAYGRAVAEVTVAGKSVNRAMNGRKTPRG